MDGSVSKVITVPAQGLELGSPALMEKPSTVVGIYDPCAWRQKQEDPGEMLPSQASKPTQLQDH